MVNSLCAHLLSVTLSCTPALPCARDAPEKVLVEAVKVLLELLRGETLACDGPLRVVVHIGEEDRLGEGGSDVFPGAAVSVTAGPDLWRIGGVSGRSKGVDGDAQLTL